MTTETQERNGLFVAAEVYPIKWRLDAAIEKLSAGNIDEVRYYLAEIGRELYISILRNRPMPEVPLDVQVTAYNAAAQMEETTGRKMKKAA